MADGKDRVKFLNRFDEDLNAPPGGWDAVDRELQRIIVTAPDPDPSPAELQHQADEVFFARQATLVADDA